MGTGFNKNIFVFLKESDNIMETIEMKNRILKYIENADDRILRIMNAIIETEENGLSQSHKDILEDRLKSHQENPNEGRTWEEVRSSLKDQYGV